MKIRSLFSFSDFSFQETGEVDCTRKGRARVAALLAITGGVGPSIARPLVAGCRSAGRRGDAGPYDCQPLASSCLISQGRPLRRAASPLGVGRFAPPAYGSAADQWSALRAQRKSRRSISTAAEGGTTIPHSEFYHSEFAAGTSAPMTGNKKGGAKLRPCE